VKRRRHFAPELESLEDRLALDDVSAGLDVVGTSGATINTGIHARGLTTPGGLILNGFGIGIGQVEAARPGKPNFDDADHSHPDVNPDQVY
jgi:hypothetical protein